jgi:hypothetical protein
LFAALVEVPDMSLEEFGSVLVRLIDDSEDHPDTFIVVEH